MSLYLISGKGGVGKTHLSTGLAYQLSQKGRKVLLVEFSHLSLYSEFFSRVVGFKGVEIDLSQGLFVASWTGLDCLAEYVASVAHSQRAADIFLKFPVLKNLIESAPGLREVAILGKLTSDYRTMKLKTDYDDIVFDAPSTGHFMSILQSPFGLKKTVGAGPMQTQCDDIIDCLDNSPDVKFIVVKDPTDFSQQEGKELHSFIKDCFSKRQDTLSVLNFSDSLMNQNSFADANANANANANADANTDISANANANANANADISTNADIRFLYKPNNLGWLMGAKELSSNWRRVIDVQSP